MEYIDLVQLETSRPSNEKRLSLCIDEHSCESWKEARAVKDTSDNLRFEPEELYLDLNKKNWLNDLTIQSGSVDHSLSLLLFIQKLSKVGEYEELENAGLQLVFMTKGRAAALCYRTNILRYEYPNEDVIWSDQSLSLPLVDHCRLEVEFYSLDALGTNQEQIGSGEFNLLQVNEEGTCHCTVELKCPNEIGVATKSGEVEFTLKFEGNGRAYPKFHASATVVKTVQDEIMSVLRKNNTPLAQEVIQKSKDIATGVSEVFSSNDIRHTFEFLDLDNNGYIGAPDLRHALICMGKLITDQEINGMIEMLDTNGDGQVNYEQFEKMGKSPNFGFEDCSGNANMGTERMEATTAKKAQLIAWTKNMILGGRFFHVLFRIIRFNVA